VTVPEWLREATAWAGDERWILWIFGLLVAFGIADLVQRRVVRKLARHARRTSTGWDDVVLAGLGGPVSLAIWVLGISAAAAIAARYAEAGVLDQVGPARTVGLVVAFVWFGVRLARGIESGLVERYVLTEAETGPDRTTIEALGKLIRAAVVITGVLVALQSLGVSVSGVVAFGGIGGIAVGFAARDLLANFFGSIMIHLDRPFAVGDWIRSPDREIEGIVEYIGWRLSRIRTFDMRPLYVPNSVFANVVVENPSRMSHRRIHERVGVRYEDLPQAEAIAADIRALLEAQPVVDGNQPLIVNVVDYGASSVDLMVYCLVTETRWVAFHGLKEWVLLEIARIIRSHGAEIAYPTSTLHVASLPGGEPVDAVDSEGRAAAPVLAGAYRGTGTQGRGPDGGDGP
jgi:MscS family membrane protein